MQSMLLGKVAATDFPSIPMGEHPGNDSLGASVGHTRSIQALSWINFLLPGNRRIGVQFIYYFRKNEASLVLACQC